MGVVGRQGHVPLLFELRGTAWDALFCPLYFFGGRHFCTNAHGIHWMIGAIFVEFSQLILMKIVKMVVTRCQILRLKCKKVNFGWGSAPDPAGDVYGAS